MTPEYFRCSSGQYLPAFNLAHRDTWNIPVDSPPPWTVCIGPSKATQGFHEQAKNKTKMVVCIPMIF